MQRLKSALKNALARHWFRMLNAFLACMLVKTIRDHALHLVDVATFLLTLLAVFLLAMLPVEYHKLRKEK